MKNQLNEIKRMQVLAGIINESQLNEDNVYRDIYNKIDYKYPDADPNSIVSFINFSKDNEIDIINITDQELFDKYEEYVRDFLYKMLKQMGYSESDIEDFIKNKNK
jgi:hypothetical protein